MKIKNLKLKTQNNNAGLTFLEVLGSLAIILILVALTAWGFSGFKGGQELNTAASSLLSTINEARSRSISSEDASQYGVHFESSKATLFKGGSYSASDPDNEELVISPSVDIYQITLNGGGPDILFQRLMGGTNEYGTVSLRLKNDTAQIKVITIEASGVISVN